MIRPKLERSRVRFQEAVCKTAELGHLQCGSRAEKERQRGSQPKGELTSIINKVLTDEHAEFIGMVRKP